MEAAVFVAIFLPLFFALVGRDWKAEEEKARQRRMAEHRLNARLLRFNL